MTNKDSPLNAQRVEGTVEKSGSVPKGCRAPRERVSVTVTGSVKGDGEETQLRQVAEHAGVYPPAQRHAMEKNQRYPPAGQTDTDAVAVIEPNHAVCHQDPPARWHGGLEDEVHVVMGARQS
jgi:hypothetical protein